MLLTKYLHLLRACVWSDWRPLPGILWQVAPRHQFLTVSWGQKGRAWLPVPGIAVRVQEPPKHFSSDNGD